MANIIVGGLVIGAVVMAIVHLVKAKKNGQVCAGCSSCGTCDKKCKNERKTA